MINLEAFFPHSAKHLRCSPIKPFLKGDPKVKSMALISSHWIIGFLVFSSFWVSACTTLKTSNPTAGKVHHVVICWLKEQGSQEDKNKLVEASKKLSEIPGVLSVKAGSVLPSQRKIVDSSFDVAIIISFSNPEAMNSYLSHPHHKKMIKELVQPLTQKVLVYDFVD